MIGIYSEKQSELVGSSIYSTPDGTEVEVTNVIFNESRNAWPDAVVLGPVVKWIRKNKPSHRPSARTDDEFWESMMESRRLVADIFKQFNDVTYEEKTMKPHDWIRWRITDIILTQGEEIWNLKKQLKNI